MGQPIALVCAHNRAIEHKFFLGIVTYHHLDDGSSCVFLNRLDVKNTTILESIIKHHGIDDFTPSVKAALASSQEARKEAYAILSTSIESELAQRLAVVIKSFKASAQSASLLGELVKTFGTPVVHNILVLIGEDYSRYVTTDTKKGSTLTMETLRQKDVEVIEDDVLQEEKKERQRYEDVVGDMARSMRV